MYQQIGTERWNGMTLTIRPDPMPSSLLIRWIAELALRVPRHLLGHAIWRILQLSLHHPSYIESITLDEAEADCLVVKGVRYPGGLGMEEDLDDADEEVSEVEEEQKYVLWWHSLGLGDGVV